MKGRYSIEVKNNKATYNLQIEKQVTIIKGDLDTAMSLLVELIHQYSMYNKKSGVKVNTNVNITLETLESKRGYWKEQIQELENAVFFIDEKDKFIYTDEFVNAISKSDCYFVIMSRKAQIKKLFCFDNEVCLLNSSVEGNRTYYSLYQLGGI